MISKFKKINVIEVDYNNNYTFTFVCVIGGIIGFVGGLIVGLSIIFLWR